MRWEGWGGRDTRVFYHHGNKDFQGKVLRL